MTYLCNTCGMENQIVNQCHCDPNNLPTPDAEFDFEQWSREREERRQRLIRAVRAHFANGGAVREWWGDARESARTWSCQQAGQPASYFIPHPDYGGVVVGRSLVPAFYNPENLAHHLVSRLNLGTSFELLGM